MSTITKPNQQVPSSETTTKKKYGKNLNKLTKPPPPSTTGTKASNNSRNGLLLLSTKRGSSSQANGSAGGILASKPSGPAATKPLPSLGLHNQSSPSTHDALLGAVVGASRAETQKPDAWGVADHKKNPTNEAEHPNEAEANTNTMEQKSQAETTSKKVDAIRTETPNYDTQHQTHHDPAGSNWDEYGGRNLSGGGDGNLYNPEEPANGEDQKVTMARIAHERAEKRHAEEEARQTEQRERAAQRLRELEAKIGPAEDLGRGTASRARTLFDPNKPPNAAAEKSQPHTPPANGRGDDFNRQPVIQFSSYDDRDRGDRGSGGGPRMLFDPKSGSMVAVPSRDDGPSNGKGRKERGKKGKGRDKEPKNEKQQDGEGPRNGRKNKRDKKASSEAASPAKGDSRRGKSSNDRKHPRTCGVLYARDKRGNFSCRDGCDGDLGYGAHSVPGGRVKNSFAYSRYLDDQKQTRREESPGIMKNNLNPSFENQEFYHDEGEEVQLQTGFNVPSPAEVKFDWVKSSDKIELITGVEQSPTLQATAKAWAPSQAAIVATSRSEPAGPKENNASNQSVEAAEDEEDEDEGPVSIFCVFASLSLQEFLSLLTHVTIVRSWI